MADHGNGHDSHDHGVRPYIVVALILGIITYVEFAIIEYEVPFLGDGATMFWLIALSAVKFLLVILYFMHLKGDDNTYSGFFASGMVIALGTFVAFTFLMTAPSSLDYIRAQLAPEGRYTHGGGSEEADDDHGDHGLDDEVVRLIESDGASRDLATRLTDTRPRDALLSIEPPQAPTGGWTLSAASPPASPATSAAASADETRAAAEAPDVQAAAWDQELGASVYGTNCASCHQGSGQGIPGAFPPLAGGHAPDLVAREGGRGYLIDVLLYGLQGQVQVEGQSYNGVMPAWRQLGDDEIAAVINHALHAWDNADALPDGFSPLTPDEIADQRGQGLAASDVHDQRSALGEPPAEDEATSGAAEPAPEQEPVPEDEPAPADDDSIAAADVEADAAPEVEPAPRAQADGWDRARGESIYGANCASCHQGNGQGIPGAFPPLAGGHVPDLYAADGGRTYLIDALLYGLQGQIQVEGQSYNGVMPAWAFLSDDDLAAVINHVLHAWDNADALPDDVSPLTPDEIADERGQGLAGSDIHELREELDLN